MIYKIISFVIKIVTKKMIFPHEFVEILINSVTNNLMAIVKSIFLLFIMAFFYGFI